MRVIGNYLQPNKRTVLPTDCFVTVPDEGLQGALRDRNNLFTREGQT